jgi:hypothetical protein
MAVYGTVCNQLKQSNKANTIVTAITTISTILCFLAVIQMISYIKPSLQGQKPILKTIALKGLVAFSVILEFVYAILKATNAIHPSSTMNKMDLFIGLPNMIVCCVGLIFSILIVIPYRTTPYTARALPGVEKHNFFVGLIDVLNFTDVFIMGLSRLPSAFGDWRNGPEEGTTAIYQKYNSVNRPGSDTVPVMLPPSYSQVGRVNEEYEMSGRSY